MAAGVCRDITFMCKYVLVARIEAMNNRLTSRAPECCARLPGGACLKLIVIRRAAKGKLPTSTPPDAAHAARLLASPRVSTVSVVASSAA